MFKYPTVLTAWIILAAGIQLVPAQPATVTEAKMQIEKTRQDIAQEEKLWADELTREKAAEIKRKERYAEFDKDKQRLQNSLAEEENKLKGLLAKSESHQLRDKELAARFAALNAAVGREAGTLRASMARGIPYRLDKRLDALDLLMRDIEGSGISPEEAMNRLWVVYQNERRMAQEAEVYSGDFSAEEGTDPIQVKFLRVGRQFLAFSSLDETKLGILIPRGKGYVWVREKDLKYAERQAIKQAIATAEGKSVPGFVPVPVWKQSFAAPKKTSIVAMPSAQHLPETRK